MIHHYMKRPDQREIGRQNSWSYIGRLTKNEFNTIDLMMVEDRALTTSFVAMRLGYTVDRSARMLRYMGGADLTVNVRPAGSVTGDVKRIDTSLDDSESFWLPTDLAYDEWHEALGEDPRDPRYQYEYRRLAALRKLWEASNDPFVCNAIAAGTRQVTFKHKASPRLEYVRD